MGDAVCWLHLVCPRCGALAEEDSESCPRCGGGSDGRGRREHASNGDEDPRTGPVGDDGLTPPPPQSVRRQR